MDLSTFTITAVLSVLPRQIAPPPGFEARGERIADDIATAVAFGPIPFAGPAAPAAAVLALVVIADHEGAHFDPRVLSCARTADNGKTVSLFGLMQGASWRGHGRAELCSGGPLPAYLALLTLNGYAARCPRGGPGAWFRGYASGSCEVKSDAARDMCSRWARMAQARGMVGARCEGPGRPIISTSTADG